MIHSTRSNEQITMKDAIQKGLAKDGGLFVFDDIKQLNIEEICDLNYHDLCIKILGEYVDMTPIINSNYPNFDITLKYFNNYAYLELFNGPTCAFKDVALTFLPLLMDKAHIIVATSGDTGSAALSGFSQNENIDVTVLYPNNLVSELQEKQMLYFSNDRCKAYAYQGNFDDCQKLAKEVALKNKNISSANSINICRLLPQVIYYFYAYFELVRNNRIKMNDKINFVVPTGNFGNILAGYLTKKMGLPVNKFVCASNDNKVLYDFINTGVYDKNRKFIKTYSPSMDILVSSNIERLLYYHYKDVNKVKALYEEFNKTGKMVIDDYKDLFSDFISYYADNNEVIEEIRKEYKDNNYLIDPHTAVAKCAYNKFESEYYTVILSTASPYKFSKAMEDAGIKLDMNNAPLSLQKALACNKTKQIVSSDDVWRMMNEKN